MAETSEARKYASKQSTTTSPAAGRRAEIMKTATTYAYDIETGGCEE